MIQHNCKVDLETTDKESSLTRLLLCLEDTMKKGNVIQDECRREMLVHRRMLMSDYALSPSIIAQCKREMTEHCSSLYQQGASANIEQRGGRMIHCLLGAARRERNFTVSCLAVIKSLVRAVDPGSDVRADPLLESTCRGVIDTLCPRVKPGDSNVIMCLLDNLKSPKMTEDCEDRLMEVAYFMARDWR
jgi:golgi apparatus protein 1